MAKSEVITVAGITYSADQWAAISAVATAAAAFIALVAALAAIIVPSRLALHAEKEARRVDAARRKEADEQEEARRQEARDQLAARYHEVASATYNAMDLVVQAAEAVASRQGRDELPILAARCRSSAGTLEILARQPGLTDGAIDSCVGAQHAVLGIVRANDYFRDDDLALDPWLELEGSLLIANQVMERMAGVVRHHAIAVRTDRPLPVLPESMRPTGGIFQ